MNALRIILTLVLIVYLFFYDMSYLKFFFSILIPYYLITQMIINPKFNSPKMKTFISMWSHPSDPQIYGTMKMNLTTVTEYLKEYSNKTGVKVGFTVYLTKVMAKMMQKFPQVNGNVIFGKFVPKSTIDMSVMVATQGGIETDMITVKNCDKLSLEEISKKLQEKKLAYENKLDKTHNRRLFVAKFLPTFLLSPFVRIMSYLSVCGWNLSWLWLPKYAYGTCVISNLGKIGIENVSLPIPPYTYCPLIITIMNKKKKKKIQPLEKSTKEETFCNLKFTIDHRYMDGAQAAKIAGEIEKAINEPETLFS